ncbi:hypothetical protein Tco_1007554, partial [Tanacetum coccineum]
MTEHPAISRRVHDNYHRVENDDLVKNIFNSRKNKEGTGMKIPAWMLTDEMKLTAHYQMTTSAPRTPNPEVTEGESSAQRKSTVIRFRVPPRRQDPETPIPTAAEIDVTNLDETIQMSIATQRSIKDYEAQQNVAKVKEHIVDEELDQLLEGTENVNVDTFMDDVLNSQEYPGTRIDPKSDKENLEAKKDVDMVIINDGEEEESAGDEFELRRREKGKGIEETKDTPPPIRSLRTHIYPLSADKETLQELIVITQDAPSSADKEKLQELMVTDSTPSSSSPKPKTGRFIRYKSFIQWMGRRYGYMFGYLKKHFMLRKSFHELARILQSTMEESLPSMVGDRVNEIAKKTVPLYVAEGLLLDKQKTQADVAAMIA